MWISQEGQHFETQCHVPRRAEIADCGGRNLREGDAGNMRHVSTGFPELPLECFGLSELTILLYEALCDWHLFYYYLI